MYVPGRGGGWPFPGSPGPRCDESESASAVTLPRPRLRTPDIAPASSDAPYMLVPSPLSASYTPPPTSFQACVMA